MGETFKVEKLEQNNKIIGRKKGSNAKKSIFSNIVNYFLGDKKQANSKALNCLNLANTTSQNGLKTTEEKTEGLKGNNVAKFFKIKQVKTAIIVLIFSVVALVILSSSFGTSSNETKVSSGYMTSLEYCEKIENKLVEVLSKISGVGDIKVMVTVESGPEIKIATSTDERTNTTTNGNNVTTNTTVVSDPVIVNSSGKNDPLILSEISPKITGVIVVADGAKDAKVRLNLLEAIEALLNVSTNNIQIYY